jgi:hypothetical protein
MNSSAAAEQTDGSEIPAGQAPSAEKTPVKVSIEPGAEKKGKGIRKKIGIVAGTITIIGAAVAGIMFFTKKD